MVTATSQPAPSTAGTIWAGRSFRLLWTGETISRTGTAVSGVALPLVATVSLHASPFLVAVLTSAVWLPWLIIGLPAGVLVDRVPVRGVMLACDVVSAVALLSVPVAWWTGTLTIVHLVAAAMVVGAAGVLFLSAYQVMISAVVRPEQLGAANAWIQGSEAGSRLAGPAIGGWLAQALTPVVGVFVDGLSFLASALALLGVRSGAVAREPAARRSLRTEIREGLDYLGHDTFLRTIAIYAGACNLAFGAIQAVLIVFAVRTVGLAPGTIGTLLAIGGVGGLIGAALSIRVISRLGNARALVVAGVVTGPFALLLPLANHTWGSVLFVIGAVVLEAGLIVANVVIDSFRQVYCPTRVLGRVVSSTRMLTYGAGAAGTFGAGILAELVGLRVAMWVACLAQAACVLVVLASPLAKLRSLPTGPKATEPRERTMR